MALTFPVQPMKAGLGDLPVDDERWAYEIKYDGYRTLVAVDGASVRVQSTKGIDVTDRYTELADLHEGVHATSAILDGEFVVLDDEGRPQFDLVQRHERAGALYVFDVLQVDGHDTIALPYEDRRRLLGQLVEPGDHWAVPSHRFGGGAELLAATGEQGLEGIMAKRIGSLYTPGKRSPNWRKIKHRRRVDVVIGGFTAGDGNRHGTFGSLLVGRRDGDAIVFAGGVGTGFDSATLTSLHERLRSIVTDECPFTQLPPASYRRSAIWVEPILSAAIDIAEFTNDGLVRHASFIRLTEGSP